jgi:hypothetical protein
MILVAGGDSLVFGSELSDQISQFPSARTFPAQLAKLSGLEYMSAAFPGSANGAISRLALRKCQELQQQGKKFAVLIMWSFVSRFEFRFNYQTHQRNSPWCSVSPWTIETDLKKISDNYFTPNPAIEHRQLKNVLTARTTGVADFASVFYKHVGDSEYYEIYSSFREFIFMQDYLKLNGIPYIFLTASNTFYQHENYIRSQDSWLSDLYQLIDWDRWFFFPATSDSPTQEPKGFFHWATENKYPMGTTHPLEAAHDDAVKLIQEKFNELVTKNL